MKRVFVLLLALGLQAAFGLTFDQMKMLYERKTEEIAGGEKAALGKLAAGYATELEGLLKSLTASGDLDGALAVKGEMERVKTGEFGDEHQFDGRKLPGLLRLRGTFDVARRDLEQQFAKDRAEAAKTYLGLLEKQVVDLTREGKLDEAVEVRKVADELRLKVEEMEGAEEESDPAEEGAGEEELEKLLIGSRWTYMSDSLKEDGKRERIIRFKAGGVAEFEGFYPVKWRVKSANSVALSEDRWDGDQVMILSKDLQSYTGSAGVRDKIKFWGQKIE